MKARYATRIRAGIAQARQVQALLDGINLDPTTAVAQHLVWAVQLLARPVGSALQERAYLRTRDTAHRKSKPQPRVASTGDES